MSVTDDIKLIPQMMTCEVQYHQSNDPQAARSTQSFMIHGKDDPRIQIRLKSIKNDNPGLIITGVTFSDMYKVES